MSIKNRLMQLLEANKELENVKPPEPKLSLDVAVVKFLSEHPNPPDTELHKWAEDNKFDIHKVETQIYTLATKYVKFLIGGNSVQKSVGEKNVDASELAKGIEVEHEHTTDADTAKRIALDHLAEIKDYYTRLAKMEAEAEK